MTFASVEAIGNISKARFESLCRETLCGYAISVSTIAALLFLTIPADCPSPLRAPQPHRLWNWDGQSQLHPIASRFIAAITERQAIKLYVRAAADRGTGPLYKVLFGVTRWRWKSLMQALFWSLRLHSPAFSNQIAGIASPYLPCQSHQHVIKCVLLCPGMEGIVEGIEVALLKSSSVLKLLIAVQLS
jgi:hypothetical protein